MNKFTRGYAILEGWLSKERATKTDEIIPGHLRNGSVLDVGCGSYPYFLTHTNFRM